MAITQTFCKVINAPENLMKVLEISASEMITFSIYVTFLK